MNTKTFSEAVQRLLSKNFQILEYDADSFQLLTRFENQIVFFDWNGSDRSVETELKEIAKAVNALTGQISIKADGSVDVSLNFDINKIDPKEEIRITEWEKYNIGLQITRNSLSENGFEMLGHAIGLQELPQIIAVDETGKKHAFLIDVFYYGAASVLTHYSDQTINSFYTHFVKNGIIPAFSRCSVVSKDNPFDPRFVDTGEQIWALKRGESFLIRWDVYRFEQMDSAIELVPMDFRRRGVV